ncbi:carboxypeptidase M32 [Bacillus sp. B-jedd]|uniref:carboxypeptidase M32 n=1 Tax=Bacillus sp. B-jedd TaxID=1476857 RepID=UPI00051554DF|nr:carboxypeptidase M32 [Bacillus sp. B-jedd]CEG27593.1 carboxypeptidase Taq (M32) metallopeptidase [Bacillus sp. B-jedd]
METTEKELQTAFMEYVNKISAYQEALGLIYWDLRTGAPKAGVPRRSDVIGILSSEAFHMSTSDQMAEYIEKLSSLPLDPVTEKVLEECKKNFERNKKIPADEYREYVVLQSNAESVWEEAKSTSDFEAFRPYLEKLVEMTKKFISYWGNSGGNPYDVLLDMYEPGVTVEVLDEVFAKLRNKIIPLVSKISTSANKPETGFLFRPFPKQAQKDFSLEVLKKIGYDFNSGRLDETVHPFATGLNPGDVRVTTNYNETDFRTAVFGTIHEGGHALYEQNISKDLIGTPLCSGTSMGIHESQSLFYENFVGRSLGFWKGNFELLKKYAGSQFDGVAVEDFYKAINESKPSFIRIEADELTYPLHIIIRYEIEKGLFNDEIEVKDLPEVWNRKYEEYLGIRPENDAEGVLQDVHWAGGSFGYFPSYALGYMYAAQFMNSLEKDIPDFADRLETGDLLPVKEWFTERVHRFGKLKKPLEILQEATGEGLNPDYLIDYLYEKYCRIYQLDNNN